MKTTVRNLLNSKEVGTFVNSFTPKYNLISTIILQRKQTSLLLCKEHRQKIENENKIVEKISANGDKIAFCESLNLFARQAIQQK